MITRAIEQNPPDVRLDEPHPATRRSVLALMAALIGPVASAQDDAENRGKATARLEAMRRLAKGIKVREVTDGKPGPPLVLRPDPLLRYTNPTLRVADGTLWAWGERRRPVAVMKLGFIKEEGNQSHWRLRLNALSPKSSSQMAKPGPRESLGWNCGRCPTRRRRPTQRPSALPMPKPWPGGSR